MVPSPSISQKPVPPLESDPARDPAPDRDEVPGDPHSKDSKDEGYVAMRALTTDVTDESLLRSVSAKTVLSSFGKSFSTRSGSLSVHENDYKLSKAVTQLDDFISHDWAGGRWQKTLALLLAYNSIPASLACTVIGLVLAVLQSGFVRLIVKPTQTSSNGAYPHTGIWSSVACPVFFLLFLFFWQGIRETVCCRSQHLFVDKYCIDQTNPERKTAAVLGLAGFIRYSNRLVICWTPSYFRRVWTTYELASWFHFRKPLESIYVVPTRRAVFVMAVWLSSTLFQISAKLSLAYWYLIDPFVILLGIFGGVSAIALFILVPLIRDVELLPKHLHTFYIQEAKCFCCEHNHISPLTGEELPCDRKLVYLALESWFHDSQAPLEEKLKSSLEAFNRLVREQFAAVVLRTCGYGRIPYRDLLVALSPALWHGLDYLASFGSVPLDIFLRGMLEHLAVYFFVGPIIVNLTVRMNLLLDRVSGAPEHQALDCLLAPIRTLAMLGFAAGLWLPLTFLAAMQGGVLPLGCYILFLFILTDLLFGNHLVRTSLSALVKLSTRTSRTSTSSDSGL